MRNIPMFVLGAKQLDFRGVRPRTPYGRSRGHLLLLLNTL